MRKQYYSQLGVTKGNPYRLFRRSLWLGVGCRFLTLQLRFCNWPNYRTIFNPYLIRIVRKEHFIDPGKLILFVSLDQFEALDRNQIIDYNVDQQRIYLNS